MWTLKVGDMLVNNGRIGLITKVRHKSVQYYMGTDGPGAFFNVSKDLVYEHIDNGNSKHYLVGNTTKYRRRRK